ncbi:hypothetical protein RN001_010338 [Aquatica leii]|uniref:Glycosyltransferase family 92 protein n=1 Tax=Aquatica leii TaxID=1421715 RepID=A0AAN7SED8_9COLE|nr:hypothetical protein RN001_010338 [Aquatica leii]
MVDQVEPIRLMYCQIWFYNKKQPVIVEALKYDLSWHKEFGNYKTGIYQPYLIPCKVPSEYHNLTVAAVSLVENVCDTASNALSVFYNKPVREKHDFAICVKGMDFLLEDISSVLTEWIEMMTLLGAHKIFLYNLHVHPNVSKVLKYYEDRGRVEVVPLTLPAGQPNTMFWQHIYLENQVMEKFQGEIIPYNDCFYKHMYEYKYVVLVDIDEVIVPLNRSTWRELLSYLQQKVGTNYDSYNARNVYFFTDLLFSHKWFNDIPEYMHILNHINRDPKIVQPGYNIKSFHNTETVLSLHNHFPVECLLGKCRNYPINPKDALMFHYKRKPIETYKIFLKTTILDVTIWKYKDALVERVTKVLKELGFLVFLNLPVEYWLNTTFNELELNETCAKFPSLFHIQFQNFYWQNLYSIYGHYQIFGAYLDTRPANPHGPTVRILAMIDQIEPIRLMYCQLWFNERKEPAIVQASRYDLSWHQVFGNYKTGIYQPYLIPCKIPSEYHNLTVAAVTLVENKCDNATNALTVFYNKPKETKHDFAICVKGMDFLLEDISSILTEWIEMMTLLGAHKIFMYNFNVHPNVSKVLNYYEDHGRVEVIPLTLPAGQPNTLYWQHIYFENEVMNKFQGEIIPYNDCFYKHMYEYKYLVLVDIDEVILPLNGSTWQDLLSYLHQTAGTKYDSYNTRNVYVFTDLLFTHKWFDDVPEYMHILNHVRRDPDIQPPRYSIKSFYNTETVLSLHNHLPVNCLRGDCQNYMIDTKDALMFHYQRKPMNTYLNFLSTSILDTTIWKYKNALIEKVTKVLKKLGFLVYLKQVWK